MSLSSWISLLYEGLSSCRAEKNILIMCFICMFRCVYFGNGRWGVGGRWYSPKLGEAVFFFKLNFYSIIKETKFPSHKCFKIPCTLLHSKVAGWLVSRFEWVPCSHSSSSSPPPFPHRMTDTVTCYDKTRFMSDKRVKGASCDH